MNGAGDDGLPADGAGPAAAEAAAGEGENAPAGPPIAMTAPPALGASAAEVAPGSAAGTSGRCRQVAAGGAAGRPGHPAGRLGGAGSGALRAPPTSSLPRAATDPALKMIGSLGHDRAVASGELRPGGLRRRRRRARRSADHDDPAASSLAAAGDGVVVGVEVAVAAELVERGAGGRGHRREDGATAGNGDGRRGAAAALRARARRRAAARALMRCGAAGASSPGAGTLKGRPGRRRGEQGRW